VLLSSIALGLLVTPFAVAGDGDVMRVGAGNSADTAETRIIGQNVSTFATRQSNNKEGDGGSATYGCRSSLANEPCLDVFALRTARAFSFRSRGNEGGRILVDGDKTNPRNNRPLTTNATGVASGFNADEVDNLDAAEIIALSKPRRAVVTATGILAAAASNGVASTARAAGQGDGTYDVVFTDPVSNCALTATITSYENSGAVAVELRPDGRTVRVRTRNGGGADGTGATNVADKPFNLVASC
jgi:hypothetical protein